MPNRKKVRRENAYEPNESQPSRIVTVGWALSVVMVLACALMALAARLLSWAQPDSERLPILEEFALGSACLIGAISLLLVPVVYKVRRIPPPLGLAVFGVIVAAAPWIVVLVRSLQN